MLFGHVFRDLAAYAEGELDPSRRERVSTHLTTCAQCQASLEEIRRGIALASALTPEPMSAEMAASIRERVVMASADPSERGKTPAWRRAAAAIVAATLGVALYWQINRPWIRLHAATELPTQFEMQGRRLHDAILRGEVPLRFATADERALWEWLRTQGAPVTAMQITRTSVDRERVVPIGALVDTIGGAPVSVLAYRIDDKPVTLAFALAHQVSDRPSPGWWSKRVLHRRDSAGVNTLTWTVGGGTYVMVSELNGAGQGACVLCHTNERFTHALTNLR